MLAITNALLYRTATRDFAPGTLLTEGEHIRELRFSEIGSLPKDISVLDAGGAYLVPGLVDVHTHGRCALDFDAASEEDMRYLHTAYARLGTTTLLPTIASAPLAQMMEAVRRVKHAGYDGVHIEGRYLNPKRRGAHREDLLALPSTEELDRFLDAALGIAVHITCAPELPGGAAFVRHAAKAGATVAIGHTDASLSETEEALSMGANAFTHTFNAMPSLHHREPGPLAAAMLCENAYCEIIADGFHLHPAIVKLLYRIKGPGHAVLITDSMCAAGCEDGTYSIAGQTVFVRSGKAVNEEGHIAGSTICLYDGLMNLMRFADISLGEALPAATENPARMVGLYDTVGSLDAGKRADLLLLNRDTLAIERVYRRGQQLPLREEHHR